MQCSEILDGQMLGVNASDYRTKGVQMIYTGILMATSYFMQIAWCCTDIAAQATLLQKSIRHLFFRQPDQDLRTRAVAVTGQLALPQLINFRGNGITTSAIPSITAGNSLSLSMASSAAASTGCSARNCWCVYSLSFSISSNSCASCFSL